MDDVAQKFRDKYKGQVLAGIVETTDFHDTGRDHDIVSFRLKQTTTKGMNPKIALVEIAHNLELNIPKIGLTQKDKIMIVAGKNQESSRGYNGHLIALLNQITSRVYEPSEIPEYQPLSWQDI